MEVYVYENIEEQLGNRGEKVIVGVHMIWSLVGFLTYKVPCRQSCQTL